MGVPAFFRWLSRKYPSIVVHCVEDKPQGVDGVQIPVDCCLPNPNGVEFDNLYLDMNGIIHPCCHPENKPAPKDEDEMMVAIFEYIDRLFRIIRPRRLLYMAIDGVAPRAKMNQQRSRRFRASKETVEKVDEIAKIRQRLEESGATLPPEKKKEEHFDSNCITPGTPFMDRLAKCLHYYIHDRMNSDPAWQKIEVILSDANVPGEGEHKIMDYIRRQRASPAHDPDTHHCLCGADADLIMLGLATHETNFTIIREEFRPNQPRSCELCNQVGHEMKDCMGVPKESAGEFNEIEVQPVADQEFIFLRLNVLREYLERELEMFNLPFQYDFERALDDWVFMCFFVGNDFLPHLPSLEIREGAIDRLIGLYKRAVYNTGGYLTDSGMVNLDRVQVILKELGEMEDEIFKRRQENEISFKQRQKERKKRMKTSKPLWIPSGQFAPVPIGSSPGAVQDARKEAYHMRVDGISRTEKKLENVEAAQALKAMLRGEDVPPPSQGVKRKADEAGLGKNDSDSEPEPPDEVRLWEDGWKDRYYESKFEVSSDNMPFRWQVAAAYAQGLCWVLQYYYQGCPSWKWFFPYHYAPFASDFINIGDLSNRFERGTQPFNPLEQLMGVFPAASQQHLPKPWAKLMWRDDSPIIDFYPTNFKIDLNGKKFAWQGVALLPFVDERRLLKALGRVYPFLTDDERRRNVRGDDRMYIQRRHKGFDFVLGFYEGSRDYSKEFELNPGLFYGLSGTILLANDAIEPGGEVCSPVPGCPDLQDNQVACVRFRDPKFKDEYLFQATRHPKAKEAVRVLRPQDLDAAARNIWRPMIGMTSPTQRASLGPAGPRMIGHAQWSPRDGGGGSGYGCAIPPPSNYGHNAGQHHHHHQQQRGPGNRGGWQGGGGGGGGHRGGRGGGGDGYGGRREWRHTGPGHQQQQQYQQQGGGGGGGGGGGWRGPRPQQQQHQGGRGHRGGGGGHSYYGGGGSEGGRGGGGGGGGGGQQRQHLRFSY